MAGLLIFVTEIRPISCLIHAPNCPGHRVYSFPGTRLQVGAKLSQMNGVSMVSNKESMK